LKLYTYYRSQASFRVRIALNLKGLAHDDTYLHLEKGDQFAAEYRALNPQMVVPTLIDGGTKLFQSLAILEYLDEKYPNPPLLPSDIAARAWVRGFALINIADAHPLIVPRIRHYLTDDLGREDLACRRGDRLVFAGLSCRVSAGSVLIVTGANGSGKSSLLRVLATLLQPAVGRLLWDDTPVAAALPRYRAAIHYLGHLD